MNENNEQINDSQPQKEKAPALPAFLIRAAAVQAVCVAVILCGVLIIKSFFPSVYPAISGFYRQNFTAKTDADEVLGGGGINEI